VKQHAAGCFYLYGAKSLKWYKLRAFMKASKKIIELAKNRATTIHLPGGGERSHHAGEDMNGKPKTDDPAQYQRFRDSRPNWTPRLGTRRP